MNGTMMEAFVSVCAGGAGEPHVRGDADECAQHGARGCGHRGFLIGQGRPIPLAAHWQPHSELDLAVKHHSLHRVLDNIPRWFSKVFCMVDTQKWR